MDARRAYLDAIVGFGTRLAASPNRNAEHTAYLDAIKRFGQRLMASAPLATDEAPAEFRRVIMPHVRHILWRVRGATHERRERLDGAQRRLLDVLDVYPDLLGPLAEARAETTHTRLLASLLDPTAMKIADACRSALVDLLLHPVGPDAEQALPPSLDLAGATVTAERSVGGKGRVDLSLSGANALVFVEVKIDAEERPGQLTDYGAALEEHAGKRERLLVFLTVEREQLPRTARVRRHITFRDLLAAWLPVAAWDSTPEHEYLGRYLKTIAVHLYGLGHDGRFERWPLGRQRAALAYFTEEEAPS